MGNSSLDESCLTINLSLTRLDTLVESISRANALTQVILAADLEVLDSSTVRRFLEVLDDLIYRAGEICHHLKPVSENPRPIT